MDGREWTGNEGEKCFTIEQGQESKHMKWNADDSPGDQVERKREELGGEIDGRGSGM